MGKLRVFDILLDKVPPVFQSGEIITGRVVLELDEPMKMRGLRILFHGGANVHWSEKHSTGSGKNRRTTTQHYRAAENYFEHIIVLYGKAPGESGDNPIHPQGQYTYQFQFQLPVNLPSSFEGAWGQIRYWCRGTIDRPWRFDHNCKLPFTVLSHLDLNTYQPSPAQGLEGSNEKTLCCWCCASGPISATFRLAKQGYVPGEPIYINADVQNNSNRKMNATRIEFKQHIAFHATRKTRLSTNTVRNLQKGVIEPGKGDTWENVEFVIPPLPPSNLLGCRIIDIQYVLTFVVDPSGPAFDLEVPLQVVIGTIPLQQTWAQFGTPSNLYNTQYGMGAAPVPPALPSAPPASASQPPPLAPPPSYQECVFGKSRIADDEDNQYTRGQLDYAPIYTYYNFNQTTDQQQQQQPPSQPQAWS